MNLTRRAKAYLFLALTVAYSLLYKFVIKGWLLTVTGALPGSLRDVIHLGAFLPAAVLAGLTIGFYAPWKSRF